MNEMWLKRILLDWRDGLIGKIDENPVIVIIDEQ